MRSRLAFAIAAFALLALSVHPFRAADTLPSQLSDAAYWKMIADFSEPDATTMFVEWLTSNEAAYQNPIPQLTKSVAPGGVYLGVGPEQNFTYIAAVRPKIAFIIDIRGEIMLEHLMYKAIFELPVNDSIIFIRWSLGTGAPNWLASTPEFVRTGDLQRPQQN